MRSRLWLPFTIVALCVVIVAFAYLTRKPLCIDSKLVERIDTVSGASTDSMYRCGVFRHVKYSLKLAEIAKDFGPRLQRLEVFFESIGGPKEKSIWTVFLSEDLRFKIQGRQVFLTEKILQAGNNLEKGFLKIWYRERIHKDQIDFQLLEETITDLLLHAMESQKVDFLSRWPRALVTFNEYCQSPWMYLEHSQLCQHLGRAQTKGLDADLAIPSLRALLSQSLIAVYQSLGMEQQLRFLQGLGQALGTLRSGTGFDDSLIIKSDADQDVLEAAELIRRWSALLPQLSVDAQVSLHIKSRVQAELERRGFTESLESPAFDWLFEIPEKQESMRKELYLIATETPDLNLAIMDRDRLWLLPNQQSISSAALGAVRTYKRVQIRCGWPSSMEVEAQMGQSQYLIVLNQCENEFKANLRSLIVKGLKNFSGRNPKLRFVSFHLPSYKMALKRGIQPINYLWDPQWQKTTRFDKEALAFQPLAAISAIDWFRP